MSGTIFDELKYFRSLNQYKHATEVHTNLIYSLGLGPAGAGGLPLQMPSAFAAFPPSAAGSGALAAAAAHHHAAVAAAAAVDQRSGGGGGSGADGRGFLWDPSGRIHPAANFRGHPG